MQNKYFAIQNDVSVSKFVQNPYALNYGVYFATLLAAEQYHTLTSHPSHTPQPLFSDATKYNIYPPSLSILYEVDNEPELRILPPEGDKLGSGPVHSINIQSATFYIGEDILHPAQVLSNVSLETAQHYLNKRLIALNNFAQRCEATPRAAFSNKNITQDVDVAKAYALAYSANSLYNQKSEFMSLSDRVLAAMTKDCAQNLSVYTTLGVVDMYRAFESTYNHAANTLSELQKISHAVKSGFEALSDYVLVTDYLKYQQLVDNSSTYLSNAFNDLRDYTNATQYANACMACVPHKDYKEFKAAFEVTLSMTSDSSYKPSADATLIAARALNATTRRFIQGSVINHDASALETYQSLGNMLMSDIAKMESFQHKIQTLYAKMGDARIEFDDALASCVTRLTPGQIEELYISAAQRYIDTDAPGREDNHFRAYCALNTSLEMMLIPYSSSDLTGPSGLQETYNKAQQELQSILQNKVFEGEYQQKYDELYADDDEPDVGE